LRKKEYRSAEEERIAADQDRTNLLENESETVSPEPESEEPVIVTLPKETKEPVATQGPEKKEQPPGGQVRVEPHLSELITGVHIPLEEEERAREQRNLDQAIHKMLVVGLVISASLMSFGLFLDLVLQRGVPTTIPDLAEVFTRVISFRPSGFLALGLLALIATPVVRVISSILAFVYERDWRYAGITSMVLFVVILSIIIGKG
jgi:uncharacterized membrane protein